jgi:hypothetical protein
MVKVEWRDSPLEREQRRALLRGWRQMIVISFLVAIVVALVTLLTTL